MHYMVGCWRKLAGVLILFSGLVSETDTALQERQFVGGQMG